MKTKIQFLQKVFALICSSVLLFPPFVVQAIALELNGDSKVLSSSEMKSIKGGNEPKGSGSTNPGSATTDSPPKDPDPCDKCDQPPQADPILLTGGKFYLPAIDVMIPGLGRETDNNLQFERNYSSREGFQDGVCGAGWVTNLDISLYDSPGGTKSVREHEGTIVTFTQTSPSVFTADGDRKLEQQPDGSFLYTKTYGTKIKFNSSGRPEYIADRNANRLTYTYTGLLVSSITDASGRTLTFTYSGNHLAGLTDPLGRTWSYAYDTSSNLVSVTDPLSRTHAYGYTDPLDPHNLTSITDTKGNVTLYDYNAEDRVVRKTKPDGNHIDFSFNVFLGTSSMTDEAGNVWHYEYTTIGLTTLVMDPEDGIEQYAYDPVSFRMTSKTDALGHTTTYEYDSNRNLSKVTDPAGGISTFTYDSTFNKWLTQTDPNNHTKSRTLDSHGNVLKTTDALGKDTVFTYNGNGLLASRTDRNNKTTTFTYDSYGNLKTVVDPLNNVTTFDYDLVGRLTSATDAKIQVTQLVYDAGNRITKVVRPDNTEYNLTYDANNNVLTITDPLNHATTYTYNSLDLPISVKDALNNTTSFDYDAKEYLRTLTDALGRVTSVTHDGANRHTSTINAQSGTIRLEYDLAGNLKKLIDAKNQTTSFDFDNRDRLTKQTYPDNSFEEMTYDAAGNPLTKKNRAGETISYVYDASDRLVSKTSPTYSASFTSDPEGNITQVNDTIAGTFTYQYDELNRLIKSVQPGNFLVQYQYDPVGLRKKLIYPDNNFITYQYDALNQLTQIADGTDIHSFAYDAASRRTSLALANGVRTSYAYDNANHLTALETQQTTGNILITRYDYNVNPVGNWTQMTRSGTGFATQTTAYSYDDTDRLTGVAKPGLSQNYSYDAVGNRVAKTENSSTTSYTENVLNQYTKINAQTYSYDARGNLTNDGVLAMTYDTDNRLKGVSGPNGLVDYSYDIANRLIKKTVNGQVTRYIYDGWTVIAEANAAGVITKKYVVSDRIDEALVQKKGGGGIASGLPGHSHPPPVSPPGGGQDQGGGTIYLSRDGLGSTREVTNTAGSLVQRYDYDSFGVVTVLDSNGNPVSDAAKTNYLFTGRELQPESGLYNYRNRFYHSGLGRFLQPDPMNLGGGINIYTYALNDPIELADPLGLESSKTCVLADLRISNVRVTREDRFLVKTNYSPQPTSIIQSIPTNTTTPETATETGTGSGAEFINTWIREIETYTMVTTTYDAINKLLCWCTKNPSKKWYEQITNHVKFIKKENRKTKQSVVPDFIPGAKGEIENPLYGPGTGGVNVGDDGGPAF